MEARKVPAPWLPTREIYHVYEADPPIFTPGRPYTDDDCDPCPEFAFRCNDIQKGVIQDDDDDDNDIYDSDSDIDTDSETITTCITADRDSDIVEIIRVTRTPVSEARRASLFFEVVGVENSIHDSSTFRADSIHEDTPLKEAWDTTLINSVSTKPCSPGPKNWLNAQDLLKLHMMVSSTNATNAESSISSRSGETVCMTPATPTFNVDVNSRFCTPPRFMMKTWMSNLWPPKPKKGPRLKRLTLLNPS